MKRSLIKRRTLIRMHRWSGLTAAVYLILLAVTGILLNHAPGLGLDKTALSWPPLLHWYHLESEHTQPTHLPAGKHWISQYQNKIFVDGKLTETHGSVQKLSSVIHWNGMLAAAAPQNLWFFTPDGQLIERIDADLLPGKPEQLALAPQGQLLLKVLKGGYFTPDSLLSQWHPVADAVPDEQAALQSQKVPAWLEQTITMQTRPSISLEKLLIDLHSGHFWGTHGHWVADFSGLALILLALTGLVRFKRK